LTPNAPLLTAVLRETGPWDALLTNLLRQAGYMHATMRRRAWHDWDRCLSLLTRATERDADDAGSESAAENGGDAPNVTPTVRVWRLRTRGDPRLCCNDGDAYPD